MNQLFFGDNLQVLREHLKDESVDLIYLRPRCVQLARVLKKTGSFYQKHEDDF